MSFIFLNFIPIDFVLEYFLTIQRTYKLINLWYTLWTIYDNYIFSFKFKLLIQ